MNPDEQVGLRTSMYGALLLSILGIGAAIYTGSQAILLDGIFNAISVGTAWFGIRISKMIDQPYTERFPVGFIAFEPLYVLIKGLIVFGLSLTVLITSIITLVSGGNEIKLGFVY